MSSLTLPVLGALGKRVFTLLCILAVTATAAVAARVLLGGARPEAAVTPARAQPAPEVGARGGVEAELITVNPDGFHPPQITRPKGPFYLVVDNMSELPALDLRLTREAGNSLHEVRVPRGQLDWTAFLDLTPGTYVLREGAHPEWVCRLHVTP